LDERESALKGQDLKEEQLKTLTATVETLTAAEDYSKRPYKKYIHIYNT
jgi:hypothetical protein